MALPWASLFLGIFSSVVAGRVHYFNILERAEEVKSSYDYVIAGGGTAGLTVADRLTADGKCKWLASAAARTTLRSPNRHGSRGRTWIPRYVNAIEMNQQ